MTTTIAALFDDVATAHSAVYALVQYGIDRHDIRLLAQETDRDTVDYTKEGYVAETSFQNLEVSGTPEQYAGLMEEADDEGLAGTGFSDEQHQFYAEEIRRGGTLLVAEVENIQADEAEKILMRFNPVDVEERIASWRKDGYEGFGAQASPYAKDKLAEEGGVDHSSAAGAPGARPPLSQDRREEHEVETSQS